MYPQVASTAFKVVAFGDTLSTEAPQWFAAYTSAHHEQRVAEHLRMRGITAFLPTYMSSRRWKDRRVTLEVPLFPSYVFVRVAGAECGRVLAIPGVARIVGTSRRPAALPDGEIQLLMDARARNVRVEPYSFLSAGTRVRVAKGPFEGAEGILLRRKGRTTILVTVQMISSAFLLDIDAADVEPVKQVRSTRSANAQLRRC